MPALHDHLKRRLPEYRVELSGQAPMIIISSNKSKISSLLGGSGWQVLVILKYGNGVVTLSRANRNNDAFPMFRYEVADPKFSPESMLREVKAVVEGFDCLSQELFSAMGGGKRRQKRDRGSDQL